MDYFLADDLSGALDAAAAFHHAGRRVRIVRSAAEWGGDSDAVIGVTTETRNSAPGEAGRVVADAIARGRERGAALLFKKIDSTMRGPVAAEVSALAAALPGTLILFTPANPAAGRVVRDGVLWVHGKPVAETDFARDPVWPVCDSSVARLLGAAAAQIRMADAETEDDLARAVAAIASEGKPWVAVGSGALAVAVARQKFGRTPKLLAGQAATTARASRPTEPTLMIGGSAHAGNRAQAAALARDHGAVLRELDVAEPETAIRAVIADVRSTGTGALLSPATRMESAKALDAIVSAAAAVMARADVRRVFATGGETAYALCERLGIGSLEFLAELEPGLSLSRGDAALGPVWLAVKPGGFGHERTWIRAWTELRAAR